ncbi:hypothetical protein BJ742DRAFT_833616 [Cladochytrium replicatum]|nr:hypothetical protein BJ742DRAFT_833616 [Cladochytrium replicatum]
MADQSSQYWNYYYGQYASDPAQQQYGQQYDAETLKAWQEYWKNNPEAAAAYHAKANGDQNVQNGKADNEKSSEKSTVAAPAAEAGVQKREDGANVTASTSGGYAGYIPSEYYQYFGGGFEEPGVVARSMQISFRPSPKVTLVAHTIVNPFLKSNALESGKQSDSPAVLSDNVHSLKELRKNDEILVQEAKVSATEIEIVVVNNVVKELVREVIREEKLRVEGKSYLHGVSKVDEEKNMEGLITVSTNSGLAKRFDVQLKATGVSSVFSQNQEAQKDGTTSDRPRSTMNKGTTQASTLLATLQSQSAEQREEWTRRSKYGGGRPYRGGYSQRWGRYDRRYSKDDEDGREHDRGWNESKRDNRNGRDRETEISKYDYPRHDKDQPGSSGEDEDSRMETKWSSLKLDKGCSTKQRPRDNSEDSADDRRSLKKSLTSIGDKHSRRDGSERRSHSKHSRKSSSRKKGTHKRRSPSTSTESDTSRSGSSSVSSKTDSDVSRKRSSSSSSLSLSVDRRRRSSDMKRRGRDDRKSRRSETDRKRAKKEFRADKRVERNPSGQQSYDEGALSHHRRSLSSSARSRSGSVSLQHPDDRSQDTENLKRMEISEETVDGVYLKEGSVPAARNLDGNIAGKEENDFGRLEIRQQGLSPSKESSDTDNGYNCDKQKHGKGSREDGKRSLKRSEQDGSEINRESRKKKRTRKYSGEENSETVVGEDGDANLQREHDELKKKSREKDGECHRRSRHDSDGDDRDRKRKSGSSRKREKSGDRHKSSRKHR